MTRGKLTTIWSPADTMALRETLAGQGERHASPSHIRPVSAGIVNDTQIEFAYGEVDFDQVAEQLEDILDVAKHHSTFVRQPEDIDHID